KTIYLVRQEVLEGKDTRSKAEDFIESAITRAAEVHKADAPGFAGWFHKSFGVELAEPAAAAATAKPAQLEPAKRAALDVYDAREKEFGADLMRRIEQYILLN